jgi:hypothetical protein
MHVEQYNNSMVRPSGCKTTKQRTRDTMSAGWRILRCCSCCKAILPCRLMQVSGVLHHDLTTRHCLNSTKVTTRWHMLVPAIAQ